MYVVNVHVHLPYIHNVPPYYYGKVKRSNVFLDSNTLYIHVYMYMYLTFTMNHLFIVVKLEDLMFFKILIHCTYSVHVW